MIDNDALAILSVNENYTPESIKLAYRKACAKYHPDRNPAGLEMMKLVNQAYELLKNQSGTVNQQSNNPDIASYGEEIFNALSAIIHLPIEIEICGSWVWLHGDTRPHKEIIKAAGFKWAPKKCLWYYRPADYKSKGRGKYTMDEIRSAHGSERIARSERVKINKAA